MPTAARIHASMTWLLRSEKMGTPNPNRVGRAGLGRHGGEASALCVGSDDVGLDSSVTSHQGEGTR